MKRFLNTRTNYGVETVEELDTEDFKTYKEFREELRRLRIEYSLAGTSTWVSQRATKEWREAR